MTPRQRFDRESRRRAAAESDDHVILDHLHGGLGGGTLESVHFDTGWGRSRIHDIAAAAALERRTARSTTGPMVMLGTKRPSITSTWIQSAPAVSTARTSSPNRAKSADRIEGAMMIDGIPSRGLTRSASMEALPDLIAHAPPSDGALVLRGP